MMQAAYQTYDSYKDSGVPWLGKIPEDWSLERAKWIHKYKKYLNRKNECENVLSLTLRGVVNNNPDSPEGLVPDDYRTYQLFEKDDLVFKLIDLENYKTSRVGLVHEDGIMSSAYIRVRPSNNTNPRFLYYFYFFMYLEGVYNKLGAGVRSTLNQNDLLDLPVPAIDMATQDRIVAFLDQKTAEIDAAIEKKQRLIELLKEQKSILINQAVTKGLNPNAPMKDSGIEWIGHIPAHWEVKRLKNVCQIFGRIGFRGYTASDLVDEGEGAITLSPSNIHENGFSTDKVSFLSWKKYHESPEIMVFENDIIFVKTGSSYGKSAIIDKYDMEMTINPQLVVLKRFKMSASLLQRSISAPYFRIQVENNVIGGTIPTLGQNTLSALKVICPHKDDEEKIVAYCKKIESDFSPAFNNAEREIEKLKEFKQTLIAHAVTGKIKV
ncbi:MAG: restriction endonuclease subunit S [Rickettsiales bacterium]